MGDARFDRPYQRLLDARDRKRALLATPDDEIIQALAAASRASDTLLANVLATEAMNRMQRARTAMAHLAEGIICTDTTGRITQVNHAAEVLLRRTRAELLGAQMDEAIPAYGKNGQRRDRTEYPTLAAIARRQVIACDDTSYARADGSRFHVDLIAAPIVVDGSDQGAVVAFRDITGRRADEVALRRRAEQHAVVAQLGLDALRGDCLQDLFESAVEDLRRVLPVELTKILQLDPGGTTLTLRAGRGWAPAVRPHVSQVGAGRCSQAGHTLATEGPVIVKDLATDARFTGPPLLRDHGIVSGMSVVIHGLGAAWGVLGVHTRTLTEFTEDDVNFLQGVANALAYAIQRSEAAAHMQARIEERTRSLAEANRDLHTFTNSASHDLRAPIRGVDALLSALLEDHGSRLDDEARELAKRALRENQRAAGLIRDLLAFARSSQNPLKPDTIDLTVLSTTAAAQVDAAHPGRHTRWIIQPGMEVHADPRLLHIALHNLLDNAAKYSSRVPEPRVEIDLTSGPDEFRIRVRDNGVGFAMTEAHRLFEPFVRLATASGFDGTGLGLATAKRILSRHGGSLRVQAEPGEGASFEMVLPRTTRPVEAAVS